jgi:hypothetical protein
VRSCLRLRLHACHRAVDGCLAFAYPILKPFPFFSQVFLSLREEADAYAAWRRNDAAGEADIHWEVRHVWR